MACSIGDDRPFISGAPVVAAGRAPKIYGKGRICAHAGCTIVLRQTRPGAYCTLHEADELEAGPVPVVRCANGRGKGAPVAAAALLIERLVAFAGDGRAASRASGISERTIWRILHHARFAQVAVQASVIDRAIVALGVQHETSNWQCLA